MYAHLDDAMDFRAIVVSPPSEPSKVLAGAWCVTVIELNDKGACDGMHLVGRPSEPQTAEMSETSDYCFLY